MSTNPKRFRMFMDDTGNVSATRSEHPQSRYAGIIGVIMELEYADGFFSEHFDGLKRRHFLQPDGGVPNLHLRKMKRADEGGPFACLHDPNKRASWEREALHMYTVARYQVIFVGLDRTLFRERHPSWEGSFYEVLVGNAIERYFYFLRGKGVGDVMVEATNQSLDSELSKLYSKFYADGAEHIRASSLQKVLSSREIKIKDKKAGVAGLQLADLLASTCFSHCRRLYADGPTYDGFAMQVAEVIERSEFYRKNDGSPHSYGRAWRP